ncbi:hypothetical protein [Teichococcus oryzae]|uniref:Uncharacterized protein n=1 Tax=Teichococcus oryzae TaxID=1608942 RepID=A0A5B2TKG0_9PROT|nr:hypothetical protein [Pseudoroseomonas oryzae]KAA2214644.1 hypothetical protein F0Q34_02800 [Pseudoroseomonas oryzae]
MNAASSRKLPGPAMNVKGVPSASILVPRQKRQGQRKGSINHLSVEILFLILNLKGRFSDWPSMLPSGRGGNITAVAGGDKLRDLLSSATPLPAFTSNNERLARLSRRPIEALRRQVHGP